jgi:glycosyltransferase involved in cell wall biosynthesis
MNCCCICGTVRDCGKYLDNVFKNIEKIGTLFNDYIIIIYYDHSQDNTLQVLKEYQKKNNKLHFFVNNSPLLRYRTHRLALGRNTIINIIREQYSNFEYFIMMDCDDRCYTNIKLDTFQEYLFRTDWDALSFNHPVEYYDSWALSKYPFIASCFHFKDPEQGKRMITRLIELTPKNHLIQCMSAFNGFVIYRTNKFLNCHYDGRFRIDYIPKQLLLANFKVAGPIIFKDNSMIVSRKEDCEHRHFHIQAILKNNARIRIAPVCIFT